MKAAEAKTRMLAKANEYAELVGSCPMGSYGYAMRLVEFIQARTLTECYKAEQAIIARESAPSRFGPIKINVCDYAQFFDAPFYDGIEQPDDWSAYYAANNVD